MLCPSTKKEEVYYQLTDGSITGFEGMVYGLPRKVVKKLNDKVAFLSRQEFIREMIQYRRRLNVRILPKGSKLVFYKLSLPTSLP